MPRLAIWLISGTWMLCLLLALAVLAWNHKPADGTEIRSAFLWLDVTSIKYHTKTTNLFP
jgi:hypothetical protein